MHGLEPWNVRGREAGAHSYIYIQYMNLRSLSISHVKENLYMAWEQSYEYINNQQTISF